MKKKIREFMIVALTTMLVTPIFTPPKMPTIPKFNVVLPASTQEAVNRAADKAAKEAVKNLKIDWSKFNFNFKFQEGKI